VECWQETLPSGAKCYVHQTIACSKNQQTWKNETHAKKNGRTKKQISKIQKTQKQNNREKLCKKRTVKKGNKNGKNGLVHLHFCLQLFFFLDLFFWLSSLKSLK
jgi:hypothetical protein